MSVSTLYPQSQTVLPKPRKVEEKVHPPFEVVGRSELLKAIRDGKCAAGFLIYVCVHIFSYSVIHLYTHYCNIVVFFTFGSLK